MGGCGVLGLERAQHMWGEGMGVYLCNEKDNTGVTLGELSCLSRPGTKSGGCHVTDSSAPG